MAVSSLPVSIFGACLLLLHAHSSVSRAIQTGGELCPIEVTEHFLTRKPTESHVTVPSQCTTFTQGEHYLQCGGEFSGNYEWIQENPMKNYVLFDLGQNTLLTKINFTYTVVRGSERPKISFCATPANTSINSAFSNIKCDEVTVEATGDTVVGTLRPSFNNETSKIAMEITTQGIKAAFTATRVKFFGRCTPSISSTAAALGTPPPSESSATANEQSNTQPENSPLLPTSGFSVLSGKKSTLLIAIIFLSCKSFLFH